MAVGVVGKGRNIAELVAAQRAAQGLGPKVSDAGALRCIAALVLPKVKMTRAKTRRRGAGKASA